MKMYLLAVLCLVGFAMSFPTAMPEQEDVEDFQVGLHEENKDENEAVPHNVIHLDDNTLALLRELKKQILAEFKQSVIDDEGHVIQRGIPLPLPRPITDLVKKVLPWPFSAIFDSTIPEPEPEPKEAV
ncbi:uncharacterized protein LOC112054549 [Bicyclus anynana]|uniref:Uncharacterized protein LOC112054549 n=1 Tax=Bicyclus anynana TaxID=110368 RepID=A0A6J1NXY3_BICAN|nr:uncharacterized protein LOC112054549 [Bicyclus anynana]